MTIGGFLKCQSCLPVTRECQSPMAKFNAKVLLALLVIVVLLLTAYRIKPESIDAIVKRSLYQYHYDLLPARTPRPPELNYEPPPKLKQQIIIASPTGKKNSKPSEETVSAPPFINPGCIARKLSKYRSWGSGNVCIHPPIVHYVKLSMNGVGSIQLSFTDYMAMMSAYKFLLPEQIFIHSNVEIGGKYYDLARQWVGTSIVVNKMARTTSLNGKRVSFIQHSADYVKVTQVLKYGGLVMDFDVIVINGTRLKEEQRNSECVVAQEGDIPNLGFVSCIKNSSFLQEWVDHYENDYNPRLWLHNSAFVPLDILTKDKYRSTCYNIHLEDTICVHPNAKEAKTQWIAHNGVPHWRTKTAAHYYLHSDKLPSPQEKLLQSDNSLGEMMQYVNDYKVLSAK